MCESDTAPARPGNELAMAPPGTDLLLVDGQPIRDETAGEWSFIFGQFWLSAHAILPPAGSRALFYIPRSAAQAK
jgi:hypothetical protein